jgi:hypothetical protein
MKLTRTFLHSLKEAHTIICMGERETGGVCLQSVLLDFCFVEQKIK